MTAVIEQIQDQYELVGKLREGGMGAIFLVRHKLLGEQRVVKIMRPQLGGDREFAVRFVREAQTLIRVKHPNIAQLYDFFADETGSAAMVMEYIPGIDLRELLRRHGPPSLGLGIEIAIQALEAIGFLHRRQLVHRDISPDNLMLSQDADGRPLVKLIDLGIVKALEGEATGLTSTGMFIGKVRYASPEQFQAGQGIALDQRSDLYSFGIVFYELLTGQLPVVGDTASALIAAHLYHPPLAFEVTDPQGRIPSQLRSLLLQLLAKDVSQRPVDAQVVQQQLRGLASQYPFTYEELARLIPKEATPSATSQSEPLPATPVPVPPSGTTLPTAVLGTTASTSPAAGTATVAPAYEAASLAILATPSRPKKLAPWLAIPLLVACLAVGAYLAWPRLAGLWGTRAQETGVLILHAVPWGRVKSITNARGQALPLPQEPVTPLSLSLPAGTYTVVLVSPNGETTSSTTVQILPGVSTRTVVPMGRASPEEFLKELGWR